MANEPIKPIMTDQPEDEEELRARKRVVREEANQDVAVRAAATVGVMGGNAGTAVGAITGEGGALALEETMAEDDVRDETSRRNNPNRSDPTPPA